MGEGRRRRDVTAKQQEEFQKDVEKRRKEAMPITNFLIDADTQQVYFSASKTQGGIDLIQEVTLSTPISGFSDMMIGFLQIAFGPQLPDGAVPNGKPT